MDIDKKTEEELKHLKEEYERMRNERDDYLKDLKEIEVNNEEYLSSRFHVLANSLTKEIKENFYGTVKRIIWITAICLGIGSLGGILHFSDMVDKRIDDQVKKKEGLIEEKLNRVISDFETKAQKAFSEIKSRKQELFDMSYKAEKEIRARVSSIPQETSPSNVDSESVISKFDIDKWYGPLPGDVIAVAGRKADQFGMEKIVDGLTRGMFSYSFQNSFVNPASDSDKDKRITVLEAVKYAHLQMKKSHENQIPVIGGPGDKLAIFSSTPTSDSNKLYDSLWALLIGINQFDNMANLNGPVNDAKSFEKLLSNTNLLMAKKSHVKLLTDDSATMQNIYSGLEWLKANASENDIVVFYYSGHGGIRKQKDSISERGFIVPQDITNDNFIFCSDIVKKLGEIKKAKWKLIVIDT